MALKLQQHTVFLPFVNVDVYMCAKIPKSVAVCERLSIIQILQTQIPIQNSTPKGLRGFCFLLSLLSIGHWTVFDQMLYSIHESISYMVV